MIIEECDVWEAVQTYSWRTCQEPLSQIRGISGTESMMRERIRVHRVKIDGGGRVNLEFSQL